MKKRTKRGKKIVSNIFYFSLQQVSLVLFGYLFYVILGRMLSPGQYGILFTILSLFSIISIFSTFGFGEALTKLVPEMIRKKEKTKAFSLIKFSLKFTFLLSVMLSVFIFFFSDNISNLFYGSSQMTLPFQYLSSLIFFGTMMLILKGVLHSLQRFKEVFYGGVLGNTIKIVAAVALVLIGFQAIGGIISLLLWFVISSAIFFAIFLHRGSVKSSATIIKKRLFSYGFLSMISVSSMYTLQQGAIIVLGMLSSLEASAFFATAFVFGQFILFVPGAFFGATLPSFSELWVKQRKLFRSLLMITIKVSIVVTLPITIMFITLSDFLINLVYTSKYLEAGVLFPGYMFGSFLLGISMIFLISLYSANKPHVRGGIFCVGSVLNVVLLFLLIPYFGMSGAVMAFLTSTIILFLLSVYFVSKIIEISFSKRSLLIIPLNLLFFLLLFSLRYINTVYLKVLGILFFSLVYVYLLLVLKIINKGDLIILNYLPDNVVFRYAKKILTKLVS